MSPRSLRLALIVGALSVAAAYLGWTLQAKRQGAQPAVQTSGSYAADWAAQCGPLEGKAQEGCTARLDAAYGRAR